MSAVSRDGRISSPDATAVTAVTCSLPVRETRGACLVVIVGAEIGKRVELRDTPLTIGRSASVDLQLDLDNVSRSHARIERRAAGYVLLDLDSTNGTFVNDIKVGEHALRDGDQLRIGRATLKFLSGNNVEALYHEEIYQLMTLDGLTQTFNRRYFVEALDKEMVRARRHGKSFALVMLDIDHFKRINDTHGHLAGDAVLRQVTQRIKSHVRGSDVFARVGGEEFALIVPEADPGAAHALAEKVRRLVAEQPVFYERLRLPVTMSLGVALFEGAACLGDAEPSGDELMRQADEKLYAAKRAGRNCVR